MDIRVIVVTRTDFGLTLLFDVHFDNIVSQCETFHFFCGLLFRRLFIVFIGPTDIGVDQTFINVQVTPIFTGLYCSFIGLTRVLSDLVRRPRHFALTDIAENIVQNKTMSSELTSRF